MNSKTRVLNALNHKPTDHIPLRLLMMYSSSNIPFSWENQVERVEKVLELGIDDVLWLEPPLGYVEAYNADLVPGVKSSVRVLPAGKEDVYPVIIKEYDTPEGNLRQVVKKTEDWPYGDDIFLFSDFNVSRSKEYIIKDRKDISRLKYLLNNPGKNEMEKFKRTAAYLREQAERLGVALEGGWSALGDVAIWLYGMENVLVAQMEDPEFLEELLDVILEWELKRTDMLLNEGIDIMVHMAWYEGVDFWKPESYRRILKPRLKKLIEKTHKMGAKFRYIITKGWVQFMNDIIDLGIDCIAGVDPIQDKLDLCEVKAKIGDKICLMGGVNSAVMLNQWNDDEIRNAVKEAIEILSPGGGFILYPVDQIFTDTPWNKVQVLIDEWKKTWNEKK